MDPKYFENMRALAKLILKNPFSFSWTLQGLGMLRLYVEPNLRLHIWDTRFAFPNATPIHDHLQWGLTSTVLSGELHNKRYLPCSSGHRHAQPFKRMKIKAGIGCETLESPSLCWLMPLEAERFVTGESYTQIPAEIHQSIPRNGTVTIMRKEPTETPQDATVFWEADAEWGSAEPREATSEEISVMTRYAVEVWTS